MKIISRENPFGNVHLTNTHTHRRKIAAKKDDLVEKEKVNERKTEKKNVKWNEHYKHQQSVSVWMVVKAKETEVAVVLLAKA